ncbi:MAG: hypothetical protein ACRD0O_08050 [Acidimicrobiia bacterium]
METPHVQVTVTLYGWVSGASEVEISVPETSDLGRLLAAASPAEQALLFNRLRRHLVAELGDAFSGLESSREPAASSL